MFPVCDPGRARAASTSSWPRPRRTATPWTRAAACSPASRRWCITTAPSGCLSTAPSTWPCCTQCLASTDSALPRCTNQTHLWAWVHGQQDFKMMTPHNHQQRPPFFSKAVLISFCHWLQLSDDPLSTMSGNPFLSFFTPTCCSEGTPKLLVCMWTRRCNDVGLWLIKFEPAWDTI